MNDPKIMQMFADVGAVVSDSHFVYSSGRHSSVYINKDALYLHTETISFLCRLMARPFTADQVDIVVGPVQGGIILTQWVAFHLSARRSSGESLAIYAEKGSDGQDKKCHFSRGYDKYIAGKNVLVVEDVLTTGASARQVIELVRKHGGNVLGLSALCNRGQVEAKDVGDVSINSLISVTLETFVAEQCPYCAQGVPINVELGKGKAFLASR